VDHFGGHSVHRCYTAQGKTGATIINRQIEKLRDLGVSVRFGVFLETFIRRPEGRVCGVRVRENYDYKNPEAGTEKVIDAGKAVILATGGFGSDVAFRAAQDPRLGGEIDTTNKRFATAEALKEALRLGAAPVHLSHIQLGPWASPDEKGFGDGPVFADYIVFLYGLVVDPATGKRIINELGDRKTLSDALLAVGHPCIGISDSRAVVSQGWDISRGLAKGVIRKFQRLEDLASGYDIPLKELEATIEKFNGFVRDKLDREFGKPILDDAFPLDQPPYYGVRLWPKVHFTMGGVRIDIQARVLDLDGLPIGGLFAAGEVTGGVHGACRLGSCAITECLVFGRIAGRGAATER
jgi:flavocytochrome c